MKAPQAQTKLEICEACQDSRWCGEGCCLPPRLPRRTAYPADEFIAAVEEEKPASDSVTLAQADHYTYPGDEFTAAVEEETAAALPPRLPE